jgi:hypothetical protein
MKSVTSKLSTAVCKPAGVYDHEALKPPGITNHALNCYANAVSDEQQVIFGP